MSTATYSRRAPQSRRIAQEKKSSAAILRADGPALVLQMAREILYSPLRKVFSACFAGVLVAITFVTESFPTMEELEKYSIGSPPHVETVAVD